MYKPPGASEITPIKQAHFRQILGIHLKIVHAIFLKRRYSLDTFFYFDINCGHGMSEDSTQKGSPLIFLEEIQRFPGMKYEAVFIDMEKRNIDLLKQRLPKSTSCVQCFCGDHAEILPQFFSRTTTQWHYGLLYTDPDGIFNAELIADFSRQPLYQATDILINCPAAAIKRVRKSSKCQESRTLEDRLDLIKKKSWLVRQTLRRSTWQWTFLLGTNWNAFPEFSQISMVKRSSKQGKAIFEKLNYTNGERKEVIQTNLFTPGFSTYREYLRSQEFLDVKKQVFQRAHGLCEHCHNAPVKDPHHLKYADWRHGEVDVPQNIVGLCHPCHCQVHGKEN